MTQEDALDAIIRARIRSMREARGWSLDALAARCHLSASTLSRIETGHRRISIDQLVPIARALGTTLDQLVEPVEAGDVVIRPRRDIGREAITWLLTRGDEPHGLLVAKMRITATRPRRELRVHPGYDWFTVLSGTIRLQLGERVILVEAGQAAQFSTMAPHAITACDGPAEVIGIFDRDGRRAHLDALDLDDVPASGPAPADLPPLISRFWWRAAVVCTDWLVYSAGIASAAVAGLVNKRERPDERLRRDRLLHRRDDPRGPLPVLRAPSLEVPGGADWFSQRGGRHRLRRGGPDLPGQRRLFRLQCSGRPVPAVPRPA